MVEYALILLLIAIGTILAFQLMGVSISDVYCRVASGFKADACAKTTALCNDEFSNLSGSGGLSGTWKAANGQACIQGGGTLYNKCSMSTVNATDYMASLDGATLSGGNGYGIFFRASDSGLGVNGYAFQYDPGASGFVIRKWVNGREINPSIAYQSKPGYDWYGKPHKLEVKVVGNTFTGYVDGVAVLSGTDNTYTSGGTGIRTWDSTQLCVDNFSLK